MPSLDHEVLVELFRNRPELACELLAACAGMDARADRVELGSIDLSQVVSVEYRADAVILLKNREGAIVRAVIVEVQLRPDPAKHFSWPAYVTAPRSRLEGPVALLVITVDDAVTRWARKPIETASQLPTRADRDRSARGPARERGDVTRDSRARGVIGDCSSRARDRSAALVGISLLPEERKRLYLELVLKALPREIQQVIEDNMLKNYQYQSDFARKYYGQGKLEGKAEGMLEGKAEGLREAAVHIARLRVPTLTKELERLILAEVEPARLQQLINTMVSTNDEVVVCAAIAALDRSPQG